MFRLWLARPGFERVPHDSVRVFAAVRVRDRHAAGQDGPDSMSYDLNWFQGNSFASSPCKYRICQCFSPRTRGKPVHSSTAQAALRNYLSRPWIKLARSSPVRSWWRPPSCRSRHRSATTKGRRTSGLEVSPEAVAPPLSSFAFRRGPHWPDLDPGGVLRIQSGQSRRRASFLANTARCPFKTSSADKFAFSS
jgi:hypothetical protein